MENQVESSEEYHFTSGNNQPQNKGYSGPTLQSLALQGYNYFQGT